MKKYMITIFMIFILASVSYSEIDHQKNILLQFSKIEGVYIEDEGKSIEFTSKAKITDSDLKSLDKLKDIEVLSVHPKQITNNGFRNIKYLKNLRVLFVNDSNFDDTCMEYLKDLDKLERLELRNTKITDAGLQYVQNLVKLRDLYISDNNITDEGLKYLSKLPNLTRLELYGTKVTRNKVNEFWKNALNIDLVITIDRPRQNTGE